MKSQDRSSRQRRQHEPELVRAVAPEAKPGMASSRCDEGRPQRALDGAGLEERARGINLAGRRTYDTRDELSVAVSFVSAGVLLPRLAHTKISCVGFRSKVRHAASPPTRARKWTHCL